ncbi:MAG: hypothetical protein K0S70_1047 [Microbacterium sp.]|nr:hypothetical protein [Microbacterium sp.]
MGIARKWVFPIIRLVLVGVIAIALVKLAFVPAGADETDPAVPTGAIVEPRIPAVLGTVTNDVVVRATVSADPAVPVRSTAAGTVNKLFVAQGATIAAGDPVFDVKVPIERDPAKSIDAEGNPLPPIFRYETVTATASGVLSSLAVIKGQDVTIGMTAGQIAPPTFSVSGILQPEQQYRLLNQPTEATVAITGGPAPFVCLGLRISTPLAGSGEGALSEGADAAAPPGPTGSGTTVSCAVPADVTVSRRSGQSAWVSATGVRCRSPRGSPRARRSSSSPPARLQARRRASARRCRTAA